MVKEEFTMRTELVASEDGSHTYEVRRSWSEDGKKALVLELYPTLSLGRADELDLSTLHLLNHAKDFGWGIVRIVNLYSLVCNGGKPKASELYYDDENMAYIEDILESKDISEYDIVIATGNSLSTHAATLETKTDILEMLRDKGLSGQVKSIVTDSMDVNKPSGVHPLFLGLHYGKDIWRLETFDIEEELKLLSEAMKPKTKVSEPKFDNGSFDKDGEESHETAESADDPAEGEDVSAIKKKGKKKSA